MRYYCFVFSSIPLLLFGCATSYNPISRIESIGDATIADESIELTVGIQPFGDNSRFHDNLEANKISILRLTLKNISEQAIEVQQDGIVLRGAPNDVDIPQLPPKTVSKRLALNSVGYWLWGFLWLGYSECTNDNCSSAWYPIGLPIGAYNFFKAQNTNSNFEKDITDHAFVSGVLQPGESTTGMIFFGKRGIGKCAIVLSYSDSTSQKKELSLQYKL